LWSFWYNFDRRPNLSVDLCRFHCRRFFHRALGAFDYADAPLDCRFFLGEVLVANLLRQLFRNGVRWDADVYTFTAHLFDKALGIKLKFFSEIVYSDLRGNGHALLFRRSQITGVCFFKWFKELLLLTT